MPTSVHKFPDIVLKFELPDPNQFAAEERDAWKWITSTTTFDTMVVNLTPNLARLLLARVGENRKPKSAVIQRYAAVMLRRQWRLTHQGIGISTRFEVIDGQHRLYAVANSGVTIEVLIVCGVSQDAMLVLDNGVQRTDADAIRISDYALRDLEPVEATSAKRMIRGNRKFIKPPSREDLRTFIIRHREPIKFISTELWKEGRVPNVTHSEIVAVLARASYHCTHEDLTTAVRFLASGQSDSDRFEPLLTLREWLIRAKPTDMKQRYGKTARAMRAFLNGEKLGRRLNETREELFPLPDEPKE